MTIEILFDKYRDYFSKNEPTIKPRDFGNLTRQSRFLTAEVFDK